jgi:hypothetical protein
MLNTPDNLTEDGVKTLGIIKTFLTERGIDDKWNDTKAFYSPGEWKQRGEKYGTESILVIVYDGSDLRSVFSMDACYDARSYEPYEALQERLSTAGLFFEECTGWYAAVYKV